MFNPVHADDNVNVFPHVLSVENPSHSDFLKLRNMLVRTHMQDLKDVMRETHYENYRAQSIQKMTQMVVRERKRRSEGCHTCTHFNTGFS